MWKTKKNSTEISMTEGDFGISVPYKVTIGAIIDTADSVLMTIKTEKNGEALFTKTFTDIANNTIDLSFTEAESEQLEVGSYLYTMDWYKGTQFYYCIVDDGKLKVEDKP